MNGLYIVWDTSDRECDVMESGEEREEGKRNVSLRRNEDEAFVVARSMQYPQPQHDRLLRAFARGRIRRYEDGRFVAKSGRVIQPKRPPTLRREVQRASSAALVSFLNNSCVMEG